MMTARIHHAARRRGGSVAAGGAGAAGRAVRRIGVFTSGSSADDPEIRDRIAAFLQRAARIGLDRGPQHTDRISRWAAAILTPFASRRRNWLRLRRMSSSATGAASLSPLLQATRNVPIVFAIVPDPVGSGFVDSLARPGGNATGFMQYEYSLTGKWLELLKQIAPGVTRAAVLRDPGECLWDWPIRRYSVRCAVRRDGGQRDQLAGRRRDRACHHRVRALCQWRLDLDIECDCNGSSRANRRAGGSATNYQRSTPAVTSSKEVA